MSLHGYKPKYKKALWVKPEVGVVNGRRYRIRPVSKKRQTTSVEYRVMARELIHEAQKHAIPCPVVSSIIQLRDGFKYGHPISPKITEIHHRFGRAGRLLTWKPGFLGVSKEGHRFLHANPKIAREHGWMAPDGIWNDYERAVAYVEAQNKGKETK